MKLNQDLLWMVNEWLKELGYQLLVDDKICLIRNNRKVMEISNLGLEVTFNDDNVKCCLNSSYVWRTGIIHDRIDVSVNNDDYQLELAFLKQHQNVRGPKTPIELNHQLSVGKQIFLCNVTDDFLKVTHVLDEKRSRRVIYNPKFRDEEVAFNYVESSKTNYNYVMLKGLVAYLSLYGRAFVNDCLDRNMPNGICVVLEGDVLEVSKMLLNVARVQETVNTVMGQYQNIFPHVISDLYTSYSCLNHQDIPSYVYRGTDLEAYINRYTLEACDYKDGKTLVRK